MSCRSEERGAGTRREPAVLVFNGWAAGSEAWELTSFRHDWVFSYVEELDGLPDRVLDDLGEAVLVGFSMGGAMALKALVERPDRVRGLVLVSATPRMMEVREQGEDGSMKVVWPGMSERRLAALRLGTQQLFASDPSPIYARENLERGLEFLRATDLRAQLLALAEGPQGEEIRQLPVVIFQSERDGIVRPGNAEFLQRVFPQAKVCRIPGSEHVLPITIPEQIDQAVAEVLGFRR